jgi:hypothetical protein
MSHLPVRALSLSIACVLSLTACFSGDGGSASGGGSASSGSSSDSQTTLAQPAVSLKLVSALPASSANTVSSVTFGSPVHVVATVRDAQGAPVVNTVVSFAAASSMVVFSPASASALTGADGVASIMLDSASLNEAGATTLTASAQVSVTRNGETTMDTYTSVPLGVALNASTVTLGALSLGQPSISAYGTSVVSVPVLINGQAATSPIAVNFSSPCVSSSKATLSSPVTSINGVATATYKDDNCAAGSDLITAAVGNVSASATLLVATPAASNIQFVAASPAVIGIQGAGSTLPQSSAVKFKVVDRNGNGKPGVQVDFSSLQVSASGGITLSPTEAVSDAQGEVTTSVISGSTPMPVTVKASVRDAATIVTQSNTLTVTTGLPAQDFFSLSVQTYNIEGLNHDGVTSGLTVIASDRLGNPVPDGTAVNFITEGGQIVPPSCTTASGTCSVSFKSAQFKPSNGRVTVLAYAVGEDSFVDANGNNVYGAGETFHDLGYPFIDANENGVSDGDEQYLSFSNVSAPVACQTHSAGGVAALPGSYVHAPSVTNSCDGVWGKNYVRRQTVITLSGSRPVLSQTMFTMGGRCLNSFTFNLADQNNNPMPAESTVAVGNTYVTYTEPGGMPTAATLAVDGTPVVNSSSVGGTLLRLTVDGGSGCTGTGTYPAGSADLVIKTPRGLTSTVTVQIQ